MKDELIIVANELLRDLEHEQTLGCLNVYVPNPVLKQHIINTLARLVEEVERIEDLEEQLGDSRECLRTDSFNEGYEEAINSATDVLRKEGVDNTVILAVKELTM